MSADPAIRWTPIADMPAALKDGRDVLFWHQWLAEQAEALILSWDERDQEKGHDNANDAGSIASAAKNGVGQSPTHCYPTSAE